MEFMNTLQAETGMLLFCAALFGLIVGSFLNVVIHRLPIMMEKEWLAQCNELIADDDDDKAQSDTAQNESAASHGDEQARFNLLVPRSRCPHCQHQLSALDNIPVFSYLFLRGGCRYCKKSISFRYPAIEALTAITFAVVAYRFGFSIETLAALALTGALIALTFIDLDHFLLPDSITLPLLWLGLLLSLFNVFVDPSTAIIGAMAGYLSLWSVYMIFKLLTGKEGMGYGDFKLLAVFGAWFGWQVLPAIILVSSVVGAVIGISMIVFKKHERQNPIPFGPYLAIAGWITMIWQDTMLGIFTLSP